MAHPLQCVARTDLRDSRSIVVSADAVVGAAIADRLESFGDGSRPSLVPLGSDIGEIGDLRLAVIVPGEATERDRAQRLDALRGMLRSIAAHRVDQVILVSSGAIYGPDHHLIGFVPEDTRRRAAIRSQLAFWWEDVENTARDEMKIRPGVKLLVLRLPFVVGGDGAYFVDRVISRRRLVRYAGFDPPLQFLSVSGLAAAIEPASEHRLSGVYHVAPDDVVPLCTFLKSMGIRSVAIPRFIQNFLRPLFLRFLDGVNSTDEIDFFRYPWTLSGEKFSRKTGLQLSSSKALEDAGAKLPRGWPDFDKFGSDESFIRRRGRSLFRFAEKYFWRIESRGFEHFPRTGGAIVVGPHRGFMPLDGVMMLHLIYRYVGRVIRFLIHPTLAKFPYQGRFFQRVASVMACKTNAERVLEAGGILGVYPEGIRGAFKMYRDAYKFGRFGRSDYARWALQFDVPVIPFAIVGSAEIFPIIGKIKWKWLKNYLEWPFIPITLTFPLLPLPLPTKWHVEFLSPVYPSDIRVMAQELGKDPVTLYAETVRNAIEQATQQLLTQRKSIF